MRKIISYLIAFTMVFTMIPYTAFAESEASAANEPLTVSYTKVNPAYEDVLSEADLNKDGEPFTTFSSEVTYASTPEEGAAVIREYMINRVDSFMLYYKFPASEVDEEGTWFQNLCDEMFPLAYQHTGDPVGGDYLRFTYGGYSIPETSISGDGTYYYLDLPVTMTYYTTYDQEEELTAAVDTLLAEIITDGMTDYEKVKAIYDYMTANIYYDYDHYGDSSYKLQFTAYAALVNKTSVCQGYANLFYRLALECGIDSRIISGLSTNSQGVTEGHAWNIVELGEKYYLVDATWDASRAQANTDYDYFLQPSYSDHTNDAEYETDEFKAAYPMASEEYVPCTSHTAEVIPAVDPTCTESGLTEGSKCATCGKVLTAQEEVAVLGHDEVAHEAQKATCTEIGWDAYVTCSRCDYTTYEEIAAPGHTTVVDEAVASTCTSTGLTEGSHCSACGEVLVAQEVLPAIGHSMSTTVKEATCEQDGLETKMCTVCGHSENTVLPKLNHDLVSHEEKAPTCTEAGWADYETCSRCDYTTYNELAATDHTFQWVVDQQATEEQLGIKHEECTACSEKRNENTAIPKLDHVHDMTKVTASAADCTTKGNIEHYLCSKCGKYYADAEGQLQISEADVIVAALGHTEVEDAAALPTCTETGLTAGSHCSVCNKVLIAQEKVDATGHTEVIDESEAATCTKSGLTAGVHCSVCNEVLTAQEKVDATGHTEVIQQAVAETCTTDGLTEGKYCSVCDTVFATQEVIPATGHNFAWVVDTPATSNAAGSKHEECANCGEKRNENTEIPKLDCVHVMVKTEAVAATCTTDGNIEHYTCNNCGKIYADAEGQLQITADEVKIVTAGHKYKKAVTAATCTSDGYTTYACSVCDDSYVGDNVAALGHDEVIDEAVAATCTEKGMTAGSHCSVCSEVIIEQKEVAALGHDLVSHAAQDATCTEEGWEAYKTCKRCDYTTFQQLGTTMHLFAEVVVPPTCTEDGYTKLVCSDCGMTIITDTTLATGHDIEAVVTPPTCTTAGYTTFTCNKCGKSYVADHLAATGHAWEADFTVDKAATMQAPGSKSKHCANCDATTEVTKIKRIKTAKVAAIAYNAKNRTPDPVIKDFSGKKLKRGTDYTVVYKNKAGKKVVKPKVVGRYTAEITFKGDYSGSIRIQFNINPKGPGIVKLSKKGKKQFTAKWTKRTVQVTGYQIKYGLKGKTAGKTVTIKNFKTNTKTIKGLKAKKQYWVQVRSYKTVSGTTYYSAWTVKKFIKTK